MKAIALPAADSTQPALKAVVTTAVPASKETPPTAAALSVTLARAPSDARSSTQTVPSEAASTATTVNTAPADNSPTGAATEMATGSIDSALISEAPLWACTAPDRASDKAAARISFFMIVSSEFEGYAVSPRWPRASASAASCASRSVLASVKTAEIRNSQLTARKAL